MKSQLSKYLPVLLLLAMASLIRSQCFSQEDDNTKLPADSTDLFDSSDFSLELFRQLASTNDTKNVFLSPYSIWSSLSLAYLGSEGQTKAQLEDVLRVTDKVTVLRKMRALNYLYKIRQLGSKSYSFDVVNKAFFNTGNNVKKCARKILDKELEEINFQDPISAVDTINSVVSNTTHGRIPSIVSEKDLENAMMVLVNAAYFKDAWGKPFKKTLTKEAIFYGFEGQSFVEMMHQKGTFRHGMSETLGCHILELPYTLKEISFYILLPPYVTGEAGFQAVIDKLSKEELDMAFRYTAAADKVEVTLPKFKVEACYGEDLMMTLRKMGIKDLFHPLEANLATFDPTGEMSVSSTKHKAFLEVTEEGTEAAAASIAIGTGRSARLLDPPVFNCNHPFIYLIFDNLTKNILFMGTYKTPKAGKSSKC